MTSPEPTYQVGDPDPKLFCTWPEQHPGKPHVAGAGATIAAVWDD